MYCSNCGKEIIAGSKFCSRCGYDLSGTAGFSSKQKYTTMEKKFVFESMTTSLDKIADTVNAWLRGIRIDIKSIRTRSDFGLMPIPIGSAIPYEIVIEYEESAAGHFYRVDFEKSYAVLSSKSADNKLNNKMADWKRSHPNNRITNQSTCGLRRWGDTTLVYRTCIFFYY